MKALCSTVVMNVTDLQKARNYYIDILGFKLDFVFGDYVGLSYDSVDIHLSGPTHQGLKKAPGGTLLTISCDEVDEYFDAISKKGAIITGAPADQVYGLRDFVVNDPDGNTLVFGAEIKK